MLIKKTIKEEDPDTGEVKKQTVRFDGIWKEVIVGNTQLLIMLGDKEIVNTVLKVPSKKQLHIKIGIASVQADKLT